MKKFAGFDRKASPIPTWTIIKFVLGWNAIGLCIYEFALKPRVIKKNNTTEEAWNQLSSCMYYCNMCCGKLLCYTSSLIVIDLTLTVMLIYSSAQKYMLLMGHTSDSYTRKKVAILKGEVTDIPNNPGSQDK